MPGGPHEQQFQGAPSGQGRGAKALSPGGC